MLLGTYVKKPKVPPKEDTDENPDEAKLLKALLDERRLSEKPEIIEEIEKKKDEKDEK